MQPVYVDNHLLIVNKPAGIATQGEMSLEELCQAWVKKTYHKPGNVFLQPVHRLDKPVSGLVLFARTSKALARLQEMMRKRSYRKTYEALIEGVLPEEEGVLEHHLLHDDFYARVVEAGVPGAKCARLSYCRRGNNRVEISLETGRYHQIRVQFAFIGCPIVGDRKYGSARAFAKDGIALHHSKLAFDHPVTKEPLLFEVPSGF